MMNIVTSCSARGWKQYGKRFVETFLQFWPEDIKLYVVSEDALKYEWTERVAFRSLWELSTAALEFHEAHKHDQRAKGNVRNHADVGWTPNKIRQGYNFRYDAYRFSKKVFAIDIVADEVKTGKLFWIDADVVTHASVPHELLDRLLPDDTALCCLERQNYHSECGFVGYNLDHVKTPLFIKKFVNVYATGWVFGLQEWHDSWVFDWLRDKTKIDTRPIPHWARSHPLPNSELGTYMDHLKGTRKELGKTPREQVKRPQAEYWA